MLPALGMLLLDGDDLTTRTGVLALHLGMGLLVVRPHARWANTDPSMDQHR